MMHSDSPDRVNRQVRLITFRHFPIRSDETTAAFVDQLTCRCAVFENHYLQQNDWTGIATENAASSLITALEQHTDLCQAIFFQDPNAARASAKRDWCKTVPAFSACDGPASETIETYLRDLHKSEFAWIHVESPEPVNETNFRLILNAIDRDPNTDDTITILTASSGTEPLSPAPFNSVLPESLIRVPLWIYIPDQQGCTIQSVTGTSDVICTVKNALSCPSKTPVDNTREQSKDLIELAAHPGRQFLRKLTIHHDNTEAVRTSDFLFARENPAGDDSRSQEGLSGLYAKPEDVWNIHDIAREYPLVVAELTEFLAQFGKPNS